MAYLLSGLVNYVFLIITPPSIAGTSIGPADPILSIFLFLVGLIHLRGAYLLHKRRMEGLGHVLVAWFSGLLIMIVVMVILLASIMEGIIDGHLYISEIIDVGAATASFSGILSMLLFKRYRKLINSRGHGEDTKEVRQSC